MSEPVTRQRGTTTTDRYGATTLDWSDPDELVIDGCALAPRMDSEERGQGRQAVIVGWTLYAPAAADIVALDRVIARGEVLEVAGEPGVWVNPYSGATTGVEVALRRVKG